MGNTLVDQFHEMHKEGVDGMSRVLSKLVDPDDADIDTLDGEGNGGEKTVKLQKKKSSEGDGEK